MSNFYDKLTNIRGLEVETEIKDAIFETRDYYKDLTEERTCRIFSGMIFDKLRRKGVSARLVDTADFDVDYSHQFVLVPCANTHYLIDLTYSQFLDDDKGILELIRDGYVLMSDELWKKYLEDVCKKDSYVYEKMFGGRVREL